MSADWAAARRPGPADSARRREERARPQRAPARAEQTTTLPSPTARQLRGRHGRGSSLPPTSRASIARKRSRTQPPPKSTCSWLRPVGAGHWAVLSGRAAEHLSLASSSEIMRLTRLDVKAELAALSDLSGMRLAVDRAAADVAHDHVVFVTADTTSDALLVHDLPPTRAR